jgi:pyruvate formate-lyase/glycerol dehydratase family glycyl radical enzyme
MGLVTLKDIRLSDYTLDNLPLIGKLRERQLHATPEVCIERARHITRYLKEMSSPDEPMETRYAGAVNHFLSCKEPIFFDENLLAGTTTSKFFGAPVYPELTGLTIWPELDTISTREKNPLKLSKKDADALNFDIFPYWMERNILEYARIKYGNPNCMKLFERLVFFIASKAGALSHTVPCYSAVLEKGLEGIMADAAAREAASADIPENLGKREFYRAVQTALQGVITYAQKLSGKASELAAAETVQARKRNLLKMAEVCSMVPAKPARTFREAVNAVWLLQIAIHAENINMAISPGRLDQLLYPFYRADMDKGIMTIGECMELVGCLWLKLNDNTNLVPETAEELFGGAGTVPAVTVGGVDKDGEDAVNDLTYIMLRVTELLKTRDPSLNARYHYEKNSSAYRDRVAEVIANTHAVPAFHNDVVDIRVLENQGIETAHARDYAVIGCVELAPAGRSYEASSSIIFNLVSALELALFNGKRPITGDEQIGPVTGEPAGFTSFGEFRSAFEKQLEFLIGEAIRLNEYLGRVHQEILPTPLLSALFEGPLEKGTDLIRGGALYNSSGATHIGFADTVDSLNAIENAVFIDGKCTFAELLEALKADFSGFEKLHARLVNKTPKYGTDDPVAVKNSRDLIRFLYDFYQSHVNYRGGRYKPAYWTMTNHAGQGKLAGALPNGRKAFRVFASGITPVSQAAGELAACLEAVAGLDSLCIPGGEAFNLKYPAIENDEDLKKFSRAVEAYFRSGGLHIQFNIMSYETLLDAKQHPEKYPELLVRVSGYSAYFKDLNEAMKDEIITRTAYDLENGKAVPFPEDMTAMLPFV